MEMGSLREKKLKVRKKSLCSVWNRRKGFARAGDVFE